MPVDFLTNDQRQTYGAFPVEVPLTDLAQFFYLDDTDWESIASRRGAYNRLGYSLQRCTLRYLGTFLATVADTPATVVAYLARQLAISDPGPALLRYQDLEARWDHQAEIRAACGYVPFGDATMALPFVRMLYVRCWASAERPFVLFDVAVTWLREHRVVLPGISTLERVIAQVRERVAARVWGRLRDAVPVPQRQRLESLLALLEPLPTGRRISGLEDVRQRERRTSSPALIRALERLERIRDLGVGDLDLSAIPARRLKSLADYATTSKVTTIAELAEDRRIATLVAFVQAAEATAADDAVDVLDGLLDDVLRSAVRTQRATRLRTLRDLDKAALTLADRTRDLLIQREGAVTDLATYLTMHEPELTAAITQIMALARRPDEGVQRELEGKYRAVRRFLPKVLTTLDFATTPAAQPIKDAGRFLQQMEGKDHPAFATAPLAFVPPAWRAHVAPPDGLINRKLYTVCFLLQLQEGLRKREIFVPGSSHWSDPRAKLYTGAEWDRLRPTLCQALNRSKSADEEITVWQRELDERYQKTLGALTPTSTVRVVKSSDAATGKETQRLQIDALEAQPETPSSSVCAG